MTAPYRVIFMGTPGFAVPSLLTLLEDPARWHVVAVVTQPDKPAGRGQRMTPSEVKQAALAHNIPVYEFTKMRAAETLEKLTKLMPDVIVVAAYGRILPPSILSLPRFGCINVHASLLPRHRGASPIAHAILSGDSEAGVAIMKMDEGLDTGPVFAMRAMAMPADVTCDLLTTTLAQMGAALLRETLSQIAEGSVQATPQDNTMATYAPLLKKEDGQLDFRLPALALEQRIRALTPWPGTFAHLAKPDAPRVQIIKAHAVPSHSPGSPGAIIIEGSSKRLLVACGEGALWLDEVKPAGRKEMSAAAWLAGRGVSQDDTFAIAQPA